MTKDAITIGSQIIIALQTIVSRKLNPVEKGVVSVTEFITDGKKNILPGNGLIKGDARALSDKSNDIIEKNMKEIVEKDEKIRREVWERKKTKEHYHKLGEKYKVELVDMIPEGNDVSIYYHGKWYDLCSGPHLLSTG